MGCYPSFLCGGWISKPRAHSSTAGILTTEQSPWPINLFFFRILGSLKVVFLTCIHISVGVQISAQRILSLFMSDELKCTGFPLVPVTDRDVFSPSHLKKGNKPLASVLQFHDSLQMTCLKYLKLKEESARMMKQRTTQVDAVTCQSCPPAQEKNFNFLFIWDTQY